MLTACVAQCFSPNHRRTDVLPPTFPPLPLTGFSQGQAINPWWFDRPPCAVAVGHTSVQTRIDGSHPPSWMCLCLDQLLGIILLRWMSFHVLHSVGKWCLGTAVLLRKLQGLCSEEQQRVQFSCDLSWSLMQNLPFLDSIPPSLCGESQ